MQIHNASAVFCVLVCVSLSHLSVVLKQVYVSSSSH